MSDKKLVALVVGATGDIGAEAAINFAKRNYSVVLVARNTQKLERLEQTIKTQFKVPVLSYAVDVLDFPKLNAAVTEASEKLNGIDILVCAQGYFSTSLFEGKAALEEMNQVFDVNFKGSVNATKAVYPHLGRRNKGAIIYFSSYSTIQLGFPGYGAYVSAKGALTQLAKSVLEEVRNKGIKVTVLYPNCVNSHIGKQINEYFGQFHGIEESQMIQPSDICQSINYVIDQSKSACASDIFLTTMKQNFTTLDLYVDKRPIPPSPIPIDPSKKVCYITGASKGIGRTIAVRMASMGYDMALVSRSLDQLNETKRLCEVHNVRVECFSVDVTNIAELENSIHQTVQKLGNIQVVINNAGINKRKSAVIAPRDLWDQIITTNFTSALHATRTALPYMAHNPPNSGCAVLFISSAVVLQPGQAGVAAYYSTKHGINGFVGSLLEDVRQFGIKVSSISPGLVNTDIGTKKGPVEYFPPELLIQTDDCADAVSYVLNSSPNCCPLKLFIHPQHGTSPVSLVLLNDLQSKL